MSVLSISDACIWALDSCKISLGHSTLQILHQFSCKLVKLPTSEGVWNVVAHSNHFTNDTSLPQV